MSTFNSKQIIERQRGYFNSGVTRSVSFRLNALENLSGALKLFEEKIEKALYEDLGKSGMEAFMTETGMVLEEIKYLKKHLKSLCKEKRVKTPLSQFPSKSFISPEPYGTVLILSPWNYPLQLCLSPLAGAIAAGNTVVLKPSSQSPATSAVIKDLIESIYSPEFVSVLLIDREETKELLENKFDYIFFTGSKKGGQEVMSAAARFLTPVSLELGGKSPVVIDGTCSMALAARRVAFGKVLNAGQTCVAPDYVLIKAGLEEEFSEHYLKAVKEFFPGGYDDYPKIISAPKFERLKGLLTASVKAGAVIHGAEKEITDDKNLKIYPLVLSSVGFDNPVMDEEIFGPILPLISVKDMEEALSYVREHSKPLALYLFTEDKGFEKRVLEAVSFGGGCINDTIVHLASTDMSFGGVGESGMGSYHGKASFDTFTHYRSILKKSVLIDLPMRYHPYNKKKKNLIERFMG